MGGHMKITVLGAGGFIGSNMVDKLLRATDHSIVAFDFTFEKLDEALAGRPFPAGRLRLVRGDLREDLEVVRELVGSSDLVVDLIAHANPSLYVTAPLDVLQLNFFDNLEVVKLCSSASVHLIQFSSCEVYGVTGGRSQAFSEDDGAFILGPVREHRWIYSCAKQLLERTIHAYGLKSSIRYTIIRPFNFIGPRIDYIPPPGSRGGPRVFSHFVSALLHGQPMMLVDGGTARRSYTHIDDAMEAFLLILEDIEGGRKNAILNVGNPGNETSIRGLALLMRELWSELTGTPARSELRDIPGTAFYGEGYADCDRRIPEIAGLERLGWNPRYDLRTTVAETMRYYLHHVPKKTGAAGLPSAPKGFP